MDLAWAAGIAEGEGSFYIAKRKKTDRFHFALKMTDSDIVVRFSEVFDNLSMPVYVATRDLGHKAVYTCFAYKQIQAIQVAGDLWFNLGFRRREQITRGIILIEEQRVFHGLDDLRINSGTTTLA